VSPSSRSPRRVHHWLTFVVAGALAVVLVGALLFIICRQSGCGGRVVRTEAGECVGVVESVYAVDEEYRGVLDKIFKHNEWVAGEPGRYVKVVLLTPMSGAKPPRRSGTVPAQVKASLEGAYTALHRANTDRTSAPFGDPNLVKVQLVPVNFGSRQEYSDQLRDEILARSEPDHPVVAVVGLGSSLAGTEQMARALSDRGIPMVSAVASADALDARTYGGLFSVSPSSSDYVLALRKLLDARPGELTFAERSGLVVADQNNDPFVVSLREAFLKYLGYYLGGRDPQWFAGGTIDTPVAPDVFQPIVDRICVEATDHDTPLRVVFYAGRVSDFQVFAERLKGRTCNDRPLAVLVGATGFQVAATYEKELLEPAKVTVIYSTSTDRVEWSEAGKGKPEGFDSFVAAFRELFDESSLDNGYAIMYHDAVASAIQATRQATSAASVPAPGDVRVQLKNIRLTGASGTFSFPDNTYGRAKGKVVPCRQIGFTTPFRLPQDLGPYLYYTGG
jgi:ABC-type branched-subunit amino acid transport system substrate-binding protein